MAHDQAAGPLKHEPPEAADNNDCGMVEQQLPPRAQHQHQHEPGSFAAAAAGHDATAAEPMNTDEPEQPVPAMMLTSQQAAAVHPAAEEQTYHQQQHQHQHQVASTALAMGGSHGSPHSASAVTGLMGQAQAYFSAASGWSGLASMDDNADDFHAQAFVPRRDSNNNIPCFVQTSALFTNMCGYCGTRTTSGCWRRGWEVGPKKFINLCNKCGLRHKAGKLPAVPEPPPPQMRGRAVTAARAAAAASAAAGGGGGATQAHSSDAAAGGVASDGTAHEPGSDSGSPAGVVDPARAAAAPQQGRSPSTSAGRRRVSQRRPLAPKASRVGDTGMGGDAGQQHLLAQLLAAAGGDAAGAMGHTSLWGPMPLQAFDGAHQQQQQQHLAALLSGMMAPTSGSGSYAAGPGSVPAAFGSPRAAAAASPVRGLQLGGPLPAYAAPGGGGGGSSGYGITDSAQAVAAVLAAAARSDAAGGPLGLQGEGLAFGSPLSSISTTPKAAEAAAIAARDSMQSPAPKKRWTKQVAAGGNDGSMAATAALGAAGLTARPSDDAAAAGDAADALLALHRDSPVSSPKRKPRTAAVASPTVLSPVAHHQSGLPMMAVGPLGAAGGASRQVTSSSAGAMFPAAAASSQGAAHSFLGPYAQLQHVSPFTSQQPALPPAAHPGSVAALDPSAVTSWSPSDLEAWLHATGCGEAASALQAADIDGPALAGLLRIATDAGAARLDERLRVELGVDRAAVRLRLVDRLMRNLADGGTGSGGGSSTGLPDGLLLGML